MHPKLLAVKEPGIPSVIMFISNHITIVTFSSKLLFFKYQEYPNQIIASWKFRWANICTVYFIQRSGPDQVFYHIVDAYQGV